MMNMCLASVVLLVAAFARAATCDIVCAASDSPDELKATAKYVCAAEDARPVLQQAINEAARLRVKCVLLAGHYLIDSVGEESPNGALSFPSLTAKDRKFFWEFGPMQFTELEGSVAPLMYRGGAVIEMTRRLYESLPDDRPFALLYPSGGVVHSRAWSLKNLVVRLPDNRKPIVAVDGSFGCALRYENLWVVGFNAESPEVNFATARGINVPHPDCVGIRGTCGSNLGPSSMRNLVVLGFGRGFDLGGEHLTCDGLCAAYCIYGFAFNCYKAKADISAGEPKQGFGGMHYPMYCTNLCDEHNVNMPLFGIAGNENKFQGGKVKNPPDSWNPSVTIRAMNIQWPNTCPGYHDRKAVDFTKGRHRATEVLPGSWYGSVEYVVDRTTPGGGVNLTDDPFFEPGHGAKMSCRSLHKAPVLPCATSASARIGAINWDCSVPASTFFGGYQTRSLGPEKFRDRTPYYAMSCGKERIDYPVRTLAEYEREMRYAIAAGIDYFAYCWYDKTPKEGEHLVSGPLAAADAHTAELTRARTLHLQSDLRRQLGLCAILVCCQPYSDAELRALAEAMRDPAYERVEGRPLVYLFERPWTNTLSRLKGFCRGTVGSDPYAVVMCNGDVPEGDYANVDAFSAYACVFRTTNYCALAEQSVRVNEARTRHGKPIVPTFTVGWDPTPRNENPVPWCSYAPGPYHPPATPAQLLEASRGFANWVNGRRAACVPGQVLVFAWNEFEEGGWICPTVGAQGRPCDERAAAFRRVADLIHGEIKMPEGKNGGIEVR